MRSRIIKEITRATRSIKATVATEITKVNAREVTTKSKAIKATVAVMVTKARKQITVRIANTDRVSALRLGDSFYPRVVLIAMACAFTIKTILQSQLSLRTVALLGRRAILA
ncbi:MAG: hypothetical protein NVV73_07135 [Cellvibrionaceae bacterium]|nr:hypothetical protein [Cellvibrionaceae bacterium]